MGSRTAIIVGSVPISPLALAVIYGITMHHLMEKNPDKTFEQLEKVCLHLLPEIVRRLYKIKVRENFG